MKMDVTAIADELLAIVKSKFDHDCSDVQEVLIYWHNIMYILFSTLNRNRLFESSENNFDEMISMGIMPSYLNRFYNENLIHISSHIQKASNIFDKAEITLEGLRQSLLNIELDFTDMEIKYSIDKTNRDAAGAYYTSGNLSLAVVTKCFENWEYIKGHDYHIVDFSCGCGDFYYAAMNHLKKKYNIEYSTSVCWFYGTDVDPIALQICICNLLEHARRQTWGDVINHFTFGNPLIINNHINDIEDKNKLFATHRLYSTGLGLPESFFENKYDIIFGNPPWEKIRFEERKFFKSFSKSISAASQKNIRDAEIQKLKNDWPAVYTLRNVIYAEYASMSSSNFEHSKIQLSIAGELNTYALFTEMAYNMLSKNGMLALILKSTLATAPVNKKIWSHLLEQKSIKSIYLFDNKEKIFDIDSRERFMVLLANKHNNNTFDFSTGLTEPQMLLDTTTIPLSQMDLAKLNPFTKTIPNVNSNSEIGFLKMIHGNFQLFSEVYPECHFGRLIHLTAHAKYIEKNKTTQNIPIYEGKFIEQYDARYSTFRGVPDERRYTSKATAVRIESNEHNIKELPESRYFVDCELWKKYRQQYGKDYSLCWRSLTSPTNRRTMIAMILPTCPTCQSIQMLQLDDNEDLLMLLGLFNSLAFDYIVRMKMPGLDLTQSVIKQIPVPSKLDYERMYTYNGICCTLKIHILSHIAGLLKNESRLDGLLHEFKQIVYNTDNCTSSEMKKTLDLFYRTAYRIDDDTFDKIVKTFPKY